MASHSMADSLDKAFPNSRRADIERLAREGPSRSAADRELVKIMSKAVAAYYGWSLKRKSDESD